MVRVFVVYAQSFVLDTVAFILFRDLQVLGVRCGLVRSLFVLLDGGGRHVGNCNRQLLAALTEVGVFVVI